MSWWDIAAAVAVFLGALAALIGSFAQALGDLAKYRNFRKEAARAAAETGSGAVAGPEAAAGSGAVAGPEAAAGPWAVTEREPPAAAGPTDDREAIQPGARHGFLARQAGKLLSKEDVRNFLAEENLHGIKLVGQVVSLILIALWQPVKVADEQHERAEQALNDAAGWSLIVLGAALALAAGVIQGVLMVVRAA